MIGDIEQELHRHQCEVRDLFDRERFPTKKSLEDYFIGCEKKRGKAAADRLRADYRIEFERKHK